MNARAGVVTSQVAWLAALPVAASAPTFAGSVRGAVAGFIVAAFASFLPDLDHPNSTAGRYMPRLFRWLVGGHRMGMHSLLAVGVSWWLTGYLIGNPIVANAVAVGWLSHVLIDMKTVRGVGLLYPVSRRKVRFGNMVTGSDAEDRYVFRMKILGGVIAVGYGYLLFRGGF